MNSDPRQAGLEGFEPPGPPTDRLFFALFPDAATAARIAALAQRLRDTHGLAGRPLKTDRFHVTLHHLGDHAGLPSGLVEAARSAAASLAMAPFELRFDRAMSFVRKGKRGNLPFVLLGNPAFEGVWAFQQQLGWALAKAGLGRHAEKDFTPHVTLLYDDEPVAEQATEPVSWVAHELVLVHSLLGKTQHIPLGRWPLQEGATSPVNDEGR